MSPSTMKIQCKLILKKMSKAGFDVVGPEAVDSWNLSDIDYFVVNYAPHWLKDEGYNKRNVKERYCGK